MLRRIFALLFPIEPPGPVPALPREVVQVGLDGGSRPMLRYADELGLPDSQRSIVSREDREGPKPLRIEVPAPPEMQGRICALQISGLGEPLDALDYDYGQEAAEALRMAIASDSWPVVFVAPGDVEIKWVVEA